MKRILNLILIGTAVLQTICFPIWGQPAGSFEETVEQRFTSLYETGLPKNYTYN